MKATLLYFYGLPLMKLIPRLIPGTNTMHKACAEINSNNGTENKGRHQKSLNMSDREIKAM